jgi:hypothetical protein
MAELAQVSGQDLGPDELYRALCRVIDLEHSVIFTLDELLDVLELLDPKHRRAPDALSNEDERTRYRILLTTALAEADRILFWRVGEPRPAA